MTTKTEVKYWAKRCRESLHDMEHALKLNNFERAQKLANQARDDAGEAERILQEHNF